MEKDLRIAELEAEVQRLNRTICGIQNALIRAARYENEDPDTKLAGIQVLLKKAGEYEDNRNRKRR